MLRVILVDDEAPARRLMQRLLQAHPELEIVGVAASLAEAQHSIATAKPDAVFLDIELGDGSGMAFWAGLAQRPDVVFTTAHADYAWQAFDVQATDYLLKPISPARLARAIATLLDAQANRLARQGTRSDMLISRSNGHTRIIKPETISAISANRDYVELRLDDGQIELMHSTLSVLANRLPSPPFFRISRSLVVNLDHISELAVDRTLSATLSFSTQAPPLTLGRAAMARLKRLLDRK